MLEAAAVHPGRTARSHLRALAAASALPRGRVDHVLGATGLDRVAGSRAGTFSLGMTRRLGVAAALLGDPAALLLDEPVNGLDPDGVAWIRGLLRSLAAEGKRWFAELTTKNLQRATHRTVRELNTGIRDWIKAWNDDPRPYVWTKTADQILESIARYCTRINDSGR